jgi:hypothetical protein
VDRRGCLFAAARLGDVALIRALGLPATLSLGLHRLGASGLRRLDVLFAAPDLALARGGSPAHPPALVLVGWSPLARSAQPPPPLARAAAALAAARTHLGLALSGVQLWRPPTADIESLHYLLGLRRAERVSVIRVGGFQAAAAQKASHWLASLRNSARR